MNSVPSVLRKVLPSIVLLLVVFPSGRAAGQDVTGALQGTVMADGRPQPEVRLTLSGTNLQGTRQTRTDRRGFYRFLALPPGTYELRVERMGLRMAVIREIVVELGRTTELPPLVLTIQPITMEAVVTDAPPVQLDPTGTAGGGTLRPEDYAALPVDRDYKSILTILPGANESYRGDPVNVGGSTGLENQYYVDGVNVTDTKTGGRATSLPYNFVRQVDVKTGGYEAQYGRALGAVVNAITYSGTNDFEANVFGYAQPGALVMEQRLAPATVESGALSYDLGARVGGPIKKDRLWYSAAVNPRVDQVDKEITGHGTYTDRTNAVRFAGKLNWRASSTTNLELSVFGDPATRDQVNPLTSGITSVANPDALLHRIESGGVVASLRATVTPSARFILKTSLAQQWDRFSDTPSGSTEPTYVDYNEGLIGGGRHFLMNEDRNRSNLTLQGILAFPAHTLTAGVDYEDASVFSSAELLSISHQDSTYLVDDQHYSGTFRNRSPAMYIQDSWRLADRFTLSPGLRWSSQYLVGASGSTAQKITDEWQPRVGFSWQLNEAATQRLLGSYGRFYQTIPNQMAVFWYVDYYAVISYYSVDPRLPGAVPDEVFNNTTYEKDWSNIDGLRAENFDEYTLGYERLLGTAKLTARGTYRNLRSSFQFGLDLSHDPIWVLGTPGKGDFDFLPSPKRRYTALELAAEGAWRDCRYRASYVLSRNWGNYPGLFNSDFGIEQPGQVTTFWMPHQARNSTGYLPNDRTHVFKLSGAWASSTGVEAGTFVTIESGAPINDFAAGPWGPAMPYFLVQRGTAGRTPWLWNVDLRLGYQLPMAGEARWRLQMDLLHVGNPRDATTVDEVHYLTLDSSGNPATPNPNYRQPAAYQPPMAARIGIEATF